MAISANDYWLLLSASDIETKIIFIIFGLMSLACCIIVLQKYFSLRSKRKIAKDVLRKMRNVQTVDELLLIAARYETTIVGKYISQFLSVLKKISRQGNAAQEIYQLEEVLDQSIDEIMYHTESYMPVISTSAAVATLIGLFGTVSGLIHSFIKVAQEQSADIAAIAPGIAEALITTWGGLIIAIIFLGLFYLVQSWIKEFEHQLSKIADKLLWFARTVLE